MSKFKLIGLGLGIVVVVLGGVAIKKLSKLNKVEKLRSTYSGEHGWIYDEITGKHLYIGDQNWQ